MQKAKPPIVNCHTHIFTGKHVPPYLAKTFVWPPFYVLLHLPTILWLFKTYLRITDRQKYRPHSLYNRIRRFMILLDGYWISKIIVILIFIWLTINAIFIIIGWLSVISAPPEEIDEYINLIKDWLVNHKLLIRSPHWALAVGIVFFVISFVKLARNFIFFVLRNIWKFLAFLPGKKTTALLERYVLLGRFTLYKTQSRIFTKLKGQYPPGSKFVVLPMDMEFMDAGKLKKNGLYKQQMDRLVAIKTSTAGKNMEPFVFIDPRRIEQQPDFLQYTIEPGKVTLNSCDIQYYMEQKKFSGFKIYPALGYYPFDEALLPLWKYAADNGIPIMTHCIKGTIFFRGKKKKSWDTHPVFLESDGRGKTKPLSLPEKKNIDFSNNFGHPLNYLCLLSEPLLRKLISSVKNENIKTLFGYQDPDTPMQYDLKNLKICMAHYGGEEQWVKYLEADRYDIAQRLIRDRKKGISFDLDGKGSLKWGLLEQVWKFTDWYSIINALILQFPNVYADISYILSKPRIIPLLKETINPVLNPHLSTRVLFGTDFYVVRNHFSDKDLMAQLSGGLSESEFDQIARFNPQSYLATTFNQKT